VAAIRSTTLSGAEAGLEHLFRPDFHRLADPQLWLEAFSQSAWSTGAGWGLMLVYAGYTRRREDSVLNSFITGLGNNAASLLAALAIVPAVFALMPAAEAARMADSGNEGLAFIWMPSLFLGGQVFGGKVFVMVFFAALTVAALSSLIAMVELGVKSLQDLGIPRRKAVLILGVVGAGLGIPSALWMSVFKNQDWVWGLGLLVSGALFAVGAIVRGIGDLRREVNLESDGWKLGRWFDVEVAVVIPASILAMLAWWFYQSAGWDPDGFLNPFRAHSVGTCLVQWGLVMVVLAVANRWIRGRAS
jgi:NSS family neurotransmitter:Na+ symporter